MLLTRISVHIFSAGRHNYDTLRPKRVELYAFPFQASFNIHSIPPASQSVSPESQGKDFAKIAQNFERVPVS